MAAPQTNPSINWEKKDINGEWKQFSQHVKLMFQGPLKRATKEEQAAYILIWVGQKGRDIFNAWNLTEDEEKDPSTILQKFKQYTSPKTNKVFARYVFHERKQKEGEPFEAFATDLRNLVKDCGYGENTNEMVRDRIVAGILSADVREKLLNKGDELSMESAIDIAVTHEVTRQRLESMANNTPTEPKDVDAIKSRHQTPSARADQGHIKQCRNCGGSHARRSCPAFGQQCHSCRKMNHWAKVCRSVKGPYQRRQIVNTQH